MRKQPILWVCPPWHLPIPVGVPQKTNTWIVPLQIRKQNWLLLAIYILILSMTISNKEKPIYRKNTQIPPFFPFLSQPPRKKKGDVITLRSFWTSHLALRGPRGLRGLRPAHFQQAPPGTSGRVPTGNGDIFMVHGQIMSNPTEVCHISHSLPVKSLNFVPMIFPLTQNSLTTHPVTGNISRSCDSRCSGASKNSWNSC